jgi:hypothetical protein
MAFAEDQLRELKDLFPEVSQYEEGGCIYFLISQFVLPNGCTPQQVDLLLCPCPRDGYPSRLFFSEQVNSKTSRNWNSIGVRIIERNWCAFSWKISGANLRLTQILSSHLGALL